MLGPSQIADAGPIPSSETEAGFICSSILIGVGGEGWIAALVAAEFEGVSEAEA